MTMPTEPRSDLLPWSPYREGTETVLERYERLAGSYHDKGWAEDPEQLAELHRELTKTAAAMERLVRDGFEALASKYSARIAECLVMLGRLEAIL